ncbi:MAG: GNAT family N-acetyltransferase [Planctomycetaceae bacterium]|nr:GNAT family N-acetyltransferase [Planctomycetaceae bacterium]
MLDKSIPFKHVLMHRPAGTPVPQVPLPPGYSFRLFMAGDEKGWAILEASVLEFPDPIDALLYFQKDFMPYLRELERRCGFIVDDAGTIVATATAWWDYKGERRDPYVDWVSVSPDHQGKGLGKAIFSNVLERIIRIEGDRDIYLHTQTWSHLAIRIYQKAGFYITSEPGLRGWPNDEYEEALAILEQFNIKATL